MNLPPNTPVELLTVLDNVAIFRTNCIELQIHQAAVAREFQFLYGDESTTYPVAIFFHSSYLEQEDPFTVEYIIQHELGHIALKHDFQTRDINVAIRQECEADTYALLHSRVGFIKAIKTLVKNHHRIVTMNTWTPAESKVLQYELGTRLINIVKSIPTLVKAEFARVKQAQTTLAA